MRTSKFIKRNYPTMNTILLATLTALGIYSQTANAADEVRQVDHIKWITSSNSPFVAPDASQLEANETTLVFIRPLDDDDLQTSANIGIDGRFQVSLQPGHYSQVNYCSGQHTLSVAPTELKTNDLSNSYVQPVQFEPQQIHYIYVDIDDATHTPKLGLLEDAYAQQLLTDTYKQTHQISRVVADCPEVVVTEPEIKVEADKPINLEVLFDFDKAVIEPVFNQRIEAVAQFMTTHPDTTAMIEGHTDSQGSATYNMDLSLRRAEAVKQQLVNQYDIDAERLNTQGFGETRPVDSNATAQGRHNNRRVVATVSFNK